MQDQIRQIALRIKDLREISGVTAESLAKELKVPYESYVMYESGSVDIPVGILYQIANKFNVELTALLTGENPHLHIYSLVRKGKGVAVERRKEYEYEALGANFSHKKAEPFMVAVAPEAEDIPFALNSHSGQEFDYVLKGTLKIKIDNYEVTLNEGDSIFYDSGYDHGMKAMNGEPAKFLAIVF
jgi:mannose-6-phosphate isomerase-like protein (cupin superfamily)